jgi:hypothetical protein
VHRLDVPRRPHDPALQIFYMGVTVIGGDYDGIGDLLVLLGFPGPGGGWEPEEGIVRGFPVR